MPGITREIPKGSPLHQKLCKSCGVEKDVSAFRRHRNVCYDCEIKNHKEFRRNNPTAAKNWALRIYGVSVGDYEQLLVEQDYRCAICGSPGGERQLAIDHDHTTNRIRGLLCTSCNAGIGQFKENPELLQKAIDYLTQEASGAEFYVLAPARKRKYSPKLEEL